MLEKEQTGRESLRKAVQRDINSKARSAEELWEHYDWVIKRAEHYAEKTGLHVDEILNAWEEDRNYWHLNYYQESNQPEIKGDDVRVFDTVKEMLDSIGDKKFRCPACNQITTNPYECNSGHVTQEKICDWKSYGLFGTMGKGATVFVKEKIKIDTFFMPIAWEASYD